MKMKKVLMGLALMASTAFAGDDGSFLYWMVDVSSQPEYAFCYATVSIDGGDLLVSRLGEETYPVIANTDYAASGLKSEKYYVDGVGQFIGSTFLFELYNDQGDRIGYDRVSYASLLADRHIGTNLTMDSTTAYVVGPQVVPEPTSGLLMLLGVAGLALRRKRG